MKENLPEKYKGNIFLKFFNKLKLLFFKKKRVSKDIDTKSIENHFDNLKVDIDFNTNDIQKKEFMKELSNKPELLDKFSNDRLKIILQYYQEENERKRKLLNN